MANPVPPKAADGREAKVLAACVAGLLAVAALAWAGWSLQARWGTTGHGVAHTYDVLTAIGGAALLGALGASFATIRRQLRTIRSSQGALAQAHQAIQEDHARTLALEASEREFRSLAEAMPHIVWICDHTGRMRYFNRRWTDYTGTTLDTAHSPGWTMPYHPEDLPGASESWRQALATGVPYSAECRLRRVDGHYQWWLIRAVPAHEADGRIRRWYGTCTQIDDRKQAESALQRYHAELEQRVVQRTTELEQARAAAEAANRSKSLFLANMSHEIRTPLNAVAGMSRLIRKDPLSAFQRDHLNKLDAAALHLLATINDVLDFSKIESGKLQLHVEPVDIGALVARVLAMLQERALAKNLTLGQSFDALPSGLQGDGTRLQQALLNYVGNAIKFTESGHVRVRVRVDSSEPDGVVLRFEVEDTGIGIPPDTLQRLFGLFEQADDTTARHYGGTGLGLAITRRLAQAMGGDAGATSEPTRGSTFWFTARLARVEPALPVPSAPPVEDAEAALRAGFAGSRVLLAEDDPINREIGAMLLADVGLEVDLAENGQEAVRLAGRQDYRLILMDMQMPVLDGVEAARRIRQAGRCANVPIIAMTANAFAEDRRRCLEAGMDDFVAKPVDPDLLYRSLLRGLRSGRGATPQAETVV